MSFRQPDLAVLNGLLSHASEVVPMREVWQGKTSEDVIGLRHDVDDNKGSLDTAVKIARWEQSRGYQSTYFMLHSATYWERPDFEDCLAEIADAGHEIGIHANAIATALRTGRDPDEILAEGLDRLRGMGHWVIGMAAHGDELCRIGFVNDEQFSECARPEMGAPDRHLEHGEVRLKLQPRPLAAFGLLYDTHRLHRGRYLSDSGGQWNEPFPGVGTGQLHMLWHPDWWAGAFQTEKAAA